jgi:diaminopimelate decarboxylase
MAGRASQFGIDEEDLEPALDRIAGLPNLELAGFHIYSGTNSLSAPAIVANLTNFVQLFRRATARAGIRPRRLVFGSGFGIPYVDGDAPLDVAAVARDIIPVMRDLRAEPTFAATSFALEMGRWLVGPGGWLLTSVIAAKESRGTSIRACDAGFNNHLAACGMMGTVIRRNWVYANLSNPEGEVHSYMLVGPLCTTIDMLASGISLPEVRVGDLLAVANSGAYGLTASPTRFISHPEPSEVLVAGDAFEDATESRLNHPRRWAGGR